MYYPWYKKIIPDSIILRERFKRRMGYRLNLKNPRTFNEKLQWLKLNDRNPLYCMLVDKFEVKKYIGERLGKRYVIPNIGVWSSTDDIMPDELPDKFVLKCTHDSGSCCICKDLKSFDWISAKNRLNDGLNTNFYWFAREWPYKNVVPRIIAEPYMVNDSSIPEDSQELSDYKFYCFNGYVDCCMICYDRSSGDAKYYFFDREWKLLRINKRGKEAPLDFSLPRPKCLDEMFETASELSKNIPFVRVDLYQSENKVLFGEMTFYPQGGWDPNYLPETDEYFGKLIELKLAYKQR